MSVERAAALVARARQVFVLAGAGMGTESGIQDFRGPNGLWNKNPQAQRMFEIEAFRRDPEVRHAAWRMRRDSPILAAQPNAGHRALADVAAHRTVTVATQNIDGLQQRAGSDRVLELHGTFWRSVCLSCGEQRPIEEAFERLDAGDPDPACLTCGGILRTATVAFGQRLDAALLTSAAAAARTCDVALAVGSSLSVQPAASLCDVALTIAPLVVINEEPTPYDGVAVVVVRERIGPTLTRIAELVADGPTTA